MGKERNYLSGSLWDKILLFAVPLAVSGILQQLFNAADAAIVGKFDGDTALAAVGSNGSMINLLVNTFTGLSIGTNAMIGKWVGTGETERIKRAVHTTVTVAMLGGVLLGLLGIFMTPSFLVWMKSPENVIGLSTVYLSLYFAGLPFLSVYNFGAAVLRSVGDTKRPFLALTSAGILNVLLNLVFVAVFHMGVAGVAIATVISNALAAGLVLLFLVRDKGVVHLDFRKLCIDKDSLRDIARIGVPSALQSMIFAISNIYIQTSLNRLGSDVMAASSAVQNYESIVFVFARSFAQTCLTFTSQNFGAGNMQRCRKSLNWCLWLSVGICAGLSLSFYATGGWTLQLFTDSPAVIEIALKRMQYCLLSYVLLAFMEAFGDAMRGLGHSVVPMMITLLGTCLFRIVWISIVFEADPKFENAIVVYPISWAIASLAMFVSYVLVRNSVEKKILKV